MMLSDSLRTARANGCAIRVIYNAGSQPGAVREIIPVVLADEEVRAVDVLTGTEKTFKIEFLALAGETVNAPQYDPPLGRIASQLDKMTLEDVSRDLLDEMIALGWHVVITKSEVALYSLFKNGKPKKTSEVRLMFQQYVTELFVDGDGALHEVTALSSRPYRLESKSFASARAYSILSSAWPKFLDEAQSRASR